MTVPISNRFGPNATVDTTDPNNPILNIHYQDLLAYWPTLDPGEEADGDIWMKGMFLKQIDYELSLTTQFHKFAVSLTPFQTNETREGVNQVGYQYTIVLWQTNANPDTPLADAA